MAKLLSVIVSAYNEEAGIREFYAVTSGYLGELFGSGWEYEILFVNDGSRDHTGEILTELAAEDPQHVRTITFSRNFGHEAAMTAGLDYASGDGLVFMDADLQHPPQYLKEITEKMDAGYEVISMVRTC